MLFMRGFSSRALALVLVGALSSSTTTHASITISNPPMNSAPFQPDVTWIDGKAGPSEVYSTQLSDPNGTPWCHGRPTFWATGHQFDAPEVPFCKNPDGTWTSDSTFGWKGLDKKDDKSILEGFSYVDRHGCEKLDVNYDGKEDIVCVTGASRATGFGYAELYLTNADNTTTKVMDHGLQTYTSMSHRWIKKLKCSDGNWCLFDSTSTAVRKDGLPNVHRMYRRCTPQEHAAGPSGNCPLGYFRVIPGPWENYENISGESVVGDFNGDGTDDLFVYGWDATPSRMYIQSPADGSWTQVPLPNSSSAKNTMSAKLDWVTGNSKPDLIVVTGGYIGIVRYYVHVIQSIPDPPYFDFKFPYFSDRLPSNAIDVEALDVNNDGYADLYVTQEHTQGCNKDTDVTPTLDRAYDVLYVGKPPSGGKRQWEKVRLESELRGCGGLVKKFGNNHTVMVTGSNEAHVGYHYLLEWDQSKFI